ncbi:GYF domain-containing protein [Arenimonas alkanexedens]
MNSWFYVDNARDRQGPVSAEAVAAAFAAGQVTDDSLVWREGLGQWAPLRQFRDELGMGPAQAPAAIAPAGASAASPAAADKKSNGCLLAALVIGGGGIALIAILGILAAIALPAYQDYVIRSKVTMAMAEARVLKVAVAEYHATNARCPTSFDELGVPMPDNMDVTLVSLAEGRCVIEVALEGLHTSAALADRRLYLSMDESGDFVCTSDLDQPKYLPAACQ